MRDTALYVYGVVKSEPNLEWNEKGLNGENVYSVNNGEFTAFVHNCKEEPFLSEDPNEIKELIIAHNRVLEKAMEDFDGVIPLPFNTIIKKKENSSQHNLKTWLNDDKDRLKNIWDKTKGKKEYGIRIYYEKNKLRQEASGNAQIKEIEENLQGKSQGLSYLLKGKTQSRINELVQNKIKLFKEQFYGVIWKIADDIKVNVSRISIDEEKDLLCSLSILIDEQKISEIKSVLEGKMGDGFSFHIAGPFAPYSFC